MVNTLLSALKKSFDLCWKNYEHRFEPLDVETFRKRLAKFTDAELIEYGKSARYMCTSDAHLGKPPRDSDWTQLRDAKLSG